MSFINKGKGKYTIHVYIRFLCRKTWDNQLHLRSSYAHRITISFSYTCPYSIQTNFIKKMKKKKKS